MKIKSLLSSILFLFLVLVKSSAQSQCAFTITQNGALSSYTFTASQGFPAPQYLTYWTFGDGSAVINDSMPTHVYNSSGTFTVCQTVYDSLNGTTVCSHCDSVVV